MSPQPLTLHTWSGAWSLPSVDPASTKVACYLQLAFPSRWTLKESNDPDSSPNGQLPYLEHGSHLVSSTADIMTYLAKLSPTAVALAPTTEPAQSPAVSPSSPHRARGTDLDSALSAVQKAQAVAWSSVIESELADLASYTLYSSAKNYDLVHRHLATSLPFPQSHYLPSRIRTLHEARLTHVGLWQLGAPEQTTRGWQDSGLGVMNVDILDTPVEASAKERKKMTAGKFGEAELLARARQTLDLLADVLGPADFFLGQTAPTTVDLALFAQLSLILLPPFPEPLLADLIRSTYPTLQAHTLRVLSLCFPPDHPGSWPPRPLQDAKSSGWSLLASSLAAVPAIAREMWGSAAAARGEDKPAAAASKKDRDFAVKRWLYVAGASATFVVYVLASGLVQIGGDDDDEFDDDIE